MAGIAGTIIAGAPRSGTTLALKILCDGLTPHDSIGGGLSNEPHQLAELIRGWADPNRDTVAEANELIPKLIQESHSHMIKCPYLSPLFATLEPYYYVIVTFRDLRLVVASMLNHKWSAHALVDKPYWAPMLEEPQDVSRMNKVQRALISAEMFTRHGVDYRGDLQVWSYGFWDEWKCNVKDISALYLQDNLNTPKRICEDVAKGVIFSDLSFTLDTWLEACETHKISKANAAAVEAANTQMVNLYRSRGFNVKTLDDIETVVPKVKVLCKSKGVDLVADNPVAEALLQHIDATWGKPECPTDWIKLPSQRRWEYEITAKLLGVLAGARVLDAGGGQGYMAYIMSSQHDVIFNDRYDGYKQPPAPIQKVIGSFFTLPENAPFDAITCVSVLEHVPPERRLDWFEKTYRLLKPGGVAVMTFEQHPTEVFDIGDGLTLTTKEVEKLCKETSLSVVEQLESPHKCVNSRGWRPIAMKLVRE